MVRLCPSSIQNCPHPTAGSRLGMQQEVAIKRPQRWDAPFGADMTVDDIQRLLRIAPFRDMDASRFSPAIPLQGILQNDTRVRVFQPGDLIVREGDYGNSAFLISAGRSMPCLNRCRRRCWVAVSDRIDRRHGAGWLQLVRPAKYPEQRVVDHSLAGGSVAARRMDGETRIFVQDVPRLLRGRDSMELVGGEFFGEVAALSRTPYAATVLAAEPVALLEIRWQGLRELTRRAPEWKRHVEQLYREHSLVTHLRETPFLNELPAAVLEQIARETLFESYGDFEWQRDFQRTCEADPNDRIQAEPIVAEENSYPDGLILIRSGFARLSQRFGHGHRTWAYLGKGHSFGLEALAVGWKQGTPQPLFGTLRAIGYLDILRVPTAVVEQHILVSTDFPAMESPGSRNCAGRAGRASNRGRIQLPSDSRGDGAAPRRTCTGTRYAVARVHPGLSPDERTAGDGHRLGSLHTM